MLWLFKSFNLFYDLYMRLERISFSYGPNDKTVGKEYVDMELIRTNVSRCDIFVARVT